MAEEKDEILSAWKKWLSESEKKFKDVEDGIQGKLNKLDDHDRQVYSALGGWTDAKLLSGSISGCTVSATGLSLSTTGVSLSLAGVVCSVGAGGFSPAAFDNSMWVSKTCLPASKVNAAMSNMLTGAIRSADRRLVNKICTAATRVAGVQTVT